MSQPPIDRPWDKTARVIGEVDANSGATWDGHYWTRNDQVWDGGAWKWPTQVQAPSVTVKPPDSRPWWRRNLTTLIIVGAATTVVTVGAIGVALQDPKPRTTSSSGSISNGLGVRDSDYVRLLGPLPAGLSQAAAITTGHQVCDILEGGGVGTDAIAYLLGRGMTGTEAANVIYAAVESYCIDYELDAQR